MRLDGERTNCFIFSPHVYLIFFSLFNLSSHLLGDQSHFPSLGGKVVDFVFIGLNLFA
jgi:hypothetical protein